MGFIGGAIRAFGSNNVNVVKKTKSAPLQSQLDTALSDYKGLRTQGNEALSDYISKYLSNVGNYDKWTNQETGAASDFFNGTVSNRLASLRASRQQSVNSAADVAANEAIRNSSLSRVGEEGGPSSYDQRSLISTLAPIRASAAVDNANQERSDYGFVLSGQNDQAGKRMALANADAASALLPQQASRSMYSQNLGFLGNLLQSDQLNHFYGLKQQSSPWADFFDAADQGIMNGVSIASSVAGMKHGGLVRRGYADGGMAVSMMPPSDLLPGETEEQYRLRKYGINGEYPASMIAQSNAGGNGPMAAKRGGKIRGPGTGTSDSIPIKVSDGEFIMPAKAVKMPGVLPLLEAIRKMALKDSTEDKKPGDKDGRHFFSGGGVGSAGMSYDAMALSMSNQSGGGMPKGGGGGGGGLAGGAQGLQARVDRDLFAQFFPSSSTFGTQTAPEFQMPGMDSMDMPAMFQQQTA